MEAPAFVVLPWAGAVMGVEHLAVVELLCLHLREILVHLEIPLLKNLTGGEDATYHVSDPFIPLSRICDHVVS